MAPKNNSPFRYQERRISSSRSVNKKTDDALAWTEILHPKTIANYIQDPPAKNFLIASVLVVAFVIFFFSFKLFSMQVLSADRYIDLANGNRIRERIMFAPRGNIYDRNGTLLAGNTLTYRLYVTPYLLSRDESERNFTYEQVAKITNIAAVKIKSLAENEGLSYPLPILIRENVDHKTALSLMEYLTFIRGFELSKVPTRVYNAKAGLAHVIGYVGRVSPSDLEEDKEGNILPIDFIGKDGIEYQYDSLLRGINGVERVEVDALGRPIRVLANQPARSGKDITLTIDYKTQVALANAMEEQMPKAKSPKAAGVAVNPKNGEVLAMASIPYYDNNKFALGISNKEFSKLLNDKREPLLNKVITNGYPAGSTVKPMVASAALQENIVKPETIIVDTGAISVTSVYQPGRSFVFRGWRLSGLGPMDARRAIAMSSDIYFYTVGGGYGGIEGLGGDRLAKYYKLFGLGEKSGIDLPGESAGIVPDPKWKQEVKGEQWYVGDSYNLSIGQGDLIVSPLQLTLGDMAVANNGYLLKPQLLLKVEDKGVSKKQIRREVPIKKDILQIAREGMRQVLTNGTTCECTFSKVPYHVAGKSGTAETDTPGGKRPHAWYTAFAPYEDPKIMVTVILEEGSGGSLYAAPAVAKTMEAYFGQKD